MRLAAHLGGYRDRRHDPYPGHQITWHGDSTLTSATLGHQVAIEGVRLRSLKDQKQDLVLNVLVSHGRASEAGSTAGMAMEQRAA
ncbi:MAG: hypothetical protein OXD30_02540 [Bryobacterales bacterium]|nr:hypothetical protein [Bryobacterales bacterium]